MPLVDLKTDLKSLKYGNDRAGGGSSREPFITSDIPDELPNNSIDIILRDGSIVRGAQDTSRLAQLFTTPKGLKFITNTNLLSRTSVKTEATIGPAYAGGTINQGVYTPLSTLAQAAIAYSGTHLNLLGLDPTSPMAGIVEGGLFPGGGLIRYEQVARSQNDQLGDSSNNRLVSLYDTKISGSLFPKNSLVDSSDLNILSYSGGPGSVLGIGKTIIKRATNTTGINEYGSTVEDFLTGSFNKVSSAKTYFNNNYSSKKEKINTPLGEIILEATPSGSYNATENFPRGVVSNNEIVTLKTAYTKPDGSDLKYITPDETREFTANPNFKRNIHKPSKYVTTQPNRGTQYSYTVDRFSATNTQKLNTTASLKPLTQAEVGNSQLFKFYLNLINAGDPGTDQVLYWQAYVDSFSDTIGADYDSYNYVGRGYPLYKYKGFSRKISLDFTIVATNPTQLLPIYRKLNQLIQNMAPNYSNGGYLRGNFVKLTFGDYLNDVPGIVTGFTLAPIFEAGADIGARSSENNTLVAQEEDNTNETITKVSSGKQLFKAIKVSGFSFTPIADNDNQIMTSNSNFISAI